MGVVGMLSPGTVAVADPNAGLRVEVSKLPLPWTNENCRTSTDTGGPYAFALSGTLIAPNRWNRLVVALVETSPADREVSESEAKNSTIIDLGSNRPRARSQVFLGLAGVDWWENGLQVSVIAAEGDRRAAVSVARKVVVASNGSMVSLRVSPVPPRVLIARGTVSGSGIERLTCDTGPGGRTLDIESGGGVDPGAPPIVAGDELIRFTIGSNPAWRTSRTLKLVGQGRDLKVTTCLLSWKLSSKTRASLIGTAPCAGLVADAVALSAALR